MAIPRIFFCASDSCAALSKSLRDLFRRTPERSHDADGWIRPQRTPKAQAARAPGTQNAEAPIPPPGRQPWFEQGLCAPANAVLEAAKFVRDSQGANLRHGGVISEETGISS